MPPAIEFESLKLDSTYISSYRNLTESYLGNTSIHNNNNFVSSFKCEDNVLITDPLNFEVGENIPILKMNNSMEEIRMRPKKPILKKKTVQSQRPLTVINTYYAK